MATIAITCPKCENQIKVPPELEGKKIRCKECTHVFVVKAPAGAKAAKAIKADKEAVKKAKETEKAKASDGEEDANPYGVTEHDFLARCAYCAKEMESEEQVVCLNCGYNHRTRERIKTSKTLEPTGGEWFIHLLPGIICAIVLLSMIAGIVIFWTLFPRIAAENDDSWWSVFFALPGRIWNTVIALFIGFFTGKFAIKRLILHPTPPERTAKLKAKAK
jgi:DNA-directed RNA polymerase subunit RPC12/RpoP